MTGKRIGYIRVSSIEQNTARQLEGIELDHIYEEKISASAKIRPQLKIMMEHIREGDHIFVHDFDRLARNNKELNILVDEITDKKARVTFVIRGLTYKGNDDPMSRFALNIMGAASEFERSHSKERQREGIEAARKRGVYDNITGRPKKFNAEDMAFIKRMKEEGFRKKRICELFKTNYVTLEKILTGRY